MNAEHPLDGDAMVGVVRLEPRSAADGRGGVDPGVIDVGGHAALSEGRTVELETHPGPVVAVGETGCLEPCGRDIDKSSNRVPR